MVKAAPLVSARSRMIPSPRPMEKMIINWDRIDFGSNIVHIHGDNDHTIPIKNVNCNFLIQGGSHMMVLTRTKEINKIIISILLQENYI